MAIRFLKFMPIFGNVIPKIGIFLGLYSRKFVSQISVHYSPFTIHQKIVLLHIKSPSVCVPNSTSPTPSPSFSPSSPCALSSRGLCRADSLTVRPLRLMGTNVTWWSPTHTTAWIPRRRPGRSSPPFSRASSAPRASSSSS